MAQFIHRATPNPEKVKAREEAAKAAKAAAEAPPPAPPPAPAPAPKRKVFSRKKKGNK